MQPVELASVRNASDAQVAARFHPLYGAALARLPAGEQRLRGIPFRLAASGTAKRWLLLREPVTVRIDEPRPVSHVIVAHFCDASHDGDGRRPPGTPLGWVTPIGEELARYGIERADGRHQDHAIRRRFEVGEGIQGWGQLAFAAVSHLADRPLDWRGPHPKQTPGRYAAAGHSVALAVLPGTWGPAQMGVFDLIPSQTDDALLWLYAIEVSGGPAPLTAVRLEPVARGEPGRGVVVAAITLYHGVASPLRLEPRRTLRLRAPGRAPVSAEPGIIIRQRPSPRPIDERSWAAEAVAGWGEPCDAEEPDAPRDVDLSLAPDAVLEIGDVRVTARRIPAAGTLRSGGGVTIEALPTPGQRVSVTLSDGSEGPPIAARVRFVAPDGRYLPPLGHRDEVNPGLAEDSGADLRLGRSTYAYVDGRFEIDLPAGPVYVEAVRGFEYRTARARVEIGPETRELAIPLERAIDAHAEGWVAADTHVHFLAPSTALLQARAEGINMVHLLATQWGDNFTGVSDLPAGPLADPSGRHIVCPGTENRQNMLGHLGLLGAHRPVLPMASGGPPETRIGDPVTDLLADWADRCHSAGGLVIGAHFPLPYAEVAADIVAGRVDAVEMQCFPPGLDSPSILEWYRYLGCGYRLPVVGGTDKMTAEIPLGAIRTYARLDPNEPLSFDTWAAAVRAGRTFATSGPLLELTAEGHEPGDVLRLPRGGGHLQIQASARAAAPIVTALELVVDGRVVSAVEAADGSRELRLDERLVFPRSSWVAARARSDREVRSAFATSMAAHTSPVYIEVEGKRPFVRSDAEAILLVIEGARTWLETIATVRSAEERRRLVDAIVASREALQERLAREG